MTLRAKNVSSTDLDLTKLKNWVLFTKNRSCCWSSLLPSVCINDPSVFFPLKLGKWLKALRSYLNILKGFNFPSIIFKFSFYAVFPTLCPHTHKHTEEERNQNLNVDSFFSVSPSQGFLSVLLLSISHTNTHHQPLSALSSLSSNTCTLLITSLSCLSSSAH